MCRFDPWLQGLFPGKMLAQVRWNEFTLGCSLAALLLRRLDRAESDDGWRDLQLARIRGREVHKYQGTIDMHSTFII